MTDLEEKFPTSKKIIVFWKLTPTDTYGEGSKIVQKVSHIIWMAPNSCRKTCSRIVGEYEWDCDALLV